MATRVLRTVVTLAAFAAASRSVPASAREVPATEALVTGVQGSLMHVRGGDKDARVGAAGIAMTHVGFGFERGLAVRVVNTASLAAGPRGVQGGIGNAVAGGFRAPFDKSHGVVVRGGIEGSFFGNKYLWDSLLELPQIHLGYQWLVPGSVFDLAAKGGYVLAGRFNTGDGASRRLDGAPELGAIAALRVGPFDLRASYARVIARHGGGPVNLFEANLCGLASVVIVCSDVRYEVGDVRVPPAGAYRSARVSMVGLTFGLSLFGGPGR